MTKVRLKMSGAEDLIHRIARGNAITLLSAAIQHLISLYN